MAIDGNKITRKEFEHLCQLVTSNNRALRGYDDQPGLVALVITLSDKVEKIINNDLPHLKADVMDEVEELHEKTVTWPGLGKGFLGPIFVSVITAIVVTLLQRLLFP